MSSSARVWHHPEFARGAREITSISLGIGAWGLVAGVAMVKAGLPLPLVLGLSLCTYAGSAQLAVLPLLVQGAPLWVIFATAFCVNLRFIIFSAAWRPYFVALPLRRRLAVAYFTGDINYVTFMRRFPRPETLDVHVAYFWGAASVNWATWQVTSLVGIVLADLVPTHWGLEFAGTLALLGVAGTLLVDRATWIAAAVAGCAAIAAFALPFHLNIVVGIAAAIGIGVLLDHCTADPKRAPARPIASESFTR